MTGLDTSVVIRLLTGSPTAQAERARTLLDAIFAAGDQAAVSDLVVSEAYFALQYHYEVPKSEALSSLKALLESPEITGTGYAAEVLQTPRLASAKPGFFDRLIHCEYVQQGGEMATFEKKAARLGDTVFL